MNQTNEPISKNKLRLSEKIITFIKKHKIIIILLVAVVALIFAVEVILTNIQASKIMSFLEGKNFIIEYSQKSIRLISFQDNKVSVESWDSTFGQNGDITDLMDCRVKSSLFSDDFAIQANYGDYWSTVQLVVLCDDNTVLNYTYSPSDPIWREITKEELDKEHATRLCGEHKFSEWVTTAEATCAKSGSESRTCTKCGHKETQSVYVEHNFVNKICSVCGAKKPVEKSDIEANTWYTYQDVLHFQNIKLQSAFSVSNGKGMMVSYWFVCQHCHAVDETLRTNVPEFNYAINKMFTCDECGGITTVKIELE